MSRTRLLPASLLVVCAALALACGGTGGSGAGGDPNPKRPKNTDTALAKKESAAEEADRQAENERQYAEALARNAARAESLTVNAAKYRRVKTGMTYDEVHVIVGAHGQELSRVEVGGITAVVFMWQNRDGSNMNVTFQNGRVAAKAQFGLK
jgi:pyruvate/2-oxoglutarate dehydrogenase complex dihydrolipoamide acyltransferase (E2) component